MAKQFVVRMPEETHKRIQDHAKAANMSMNAFIVDVLESVTATNSETVGYRSSRSAAYASSLITSSLAQQQPVGLNFSNTNVEQAIRLLSGQQENVDEESNQGKQEGSAD